ncbi:MAG: hypothetical protein ACI33K_01395 [Clostridiaceae bacterium]
MLKNNRTLENLLEPNCKIYLYLADEETSANFIKNADKEGFTFGDGVKASKRKPDAIMALNNDKTINYLGFVGHLAFHNPEASTTYLVRVDYKKYLSGEENYMYTTTSKENIVKNEKQEPRMSDGTATVLVYDKSIGMDCEFEKWLIQEGFSYWRYSKGWYDTDCCMSINLNNKLIARGMPGKKITEPLCHHAITIEEFKTIYAIFKKYKGMNPLQF